jgi:gliding motility-associated-like protein
LKKLSLIAIIWLCAFATNAAHLVGGEISYKCVGNNNYEITLKIYRDCNSSGAQFDPSAKIGVFSNGVRIDSFTVPLGPIIQLPTTVSNPCLVIPPNICTQMATYKITKFLPPVSGGYTITHQRCCRNATISNIPNPGTWGNTYTIEIPSNDTGCNSSPAYSVNPPIILCTNDSLNINSSATELDGDSLFYELCDPLHGGKQSIPAPFPNTTNYQNVPFLAGYSATNPMNANPAFSIDPNTGYISGKPTQAGQYVVAICVSEYRNGVLLSTTMRDYQFNVTNCTSNVTTQILPQTGNCSGRTVSFSNNTINGSKFFWDFGDSSTNADTSTAQNPTYTFADTGTYQIKLVVNRGWPCSDSSTITVKVYYPVTSKYKWSGDVCLDEQQLNFVPDAGLSGNASYFWYFGPNANITQSTDEFPPPITFNAPGKYYVTLQAEDYGCSGVYGDTITIYERPNADFSIDNLVGCAPYTVNFNDNSAGGTVLKYLWDFGDGNTSVDPSPIHTYNTAGTYSVSLMVYTETGCIDTSYFFYPGNIIVNPSPNSSFIINPQEVSIYEPIVEVITDPLLAGESSILYMADGAQYQNTTIVKHAYSDTGTFAVTYVVINAYNCTDTLVKYVRVNPETNIFVPNAFTPDGDGTNEVFLPEITGALEYEFLIFDRWGQVVFKTNDPNTGWNGLKDNAGMTMPMDVYTFVINIKDLNQEFVTRNGTIMLIK